MAERYIVKAEYLVYDQDKHQVVGKAVSEALAKSMAKNFNEHDAGNKGVVTRELLRKIDDALEEAENFDSYDDLRMALEIAASEWGVTLDQGSRD